MSHQNPSIQSFFQTEVSSHKSPKALGTASIEPGDGFTSSEIESALRPTLHRWQPRAEYNEVDIGELVPGPGCVTVMGRVVNIYNQPTPSKMPMSAKGCLKVIVKDDTGAFTVKLWYHRVDYQLRLGLLVSIWAPHISNAESNSLVARGSSLVTSIFPERDNSCYFKVQERSDEGILCKIPIGHRDGKQLPGLLRLKSYIEGGHEVVEAKVLVCVKSTGGKKKFTTKKGTQTEKVDVTVFDDTADAALTLWGCTAASATPWKASNTILLLSRPGFKNDRRPTLSLNQDTHVEVDPLIKEACWLRGHAQRLTKREHVNLPFPEDVFDVDAAISSQNRVLFTLADLDEFARAAPEGKFPLLNKKFTGYLSLTIIEINIFSLYRRNMLFCTECCGVPLFANTTSAPCKHCDTPNSMRINPRLVGLLVDETGGITAGKLIWSEEAWWQLLGRTAEELAGSDAVLLKYLENRLLFLKPVILFGWSGEVGKLVVLRVTIV